MIPVSDTMFVDIDNTIKVPAAGYGAILLVLNIQQEQPGKCRNARYPRYRK